MGAKCKLACGAQRQTVCRWRAGLEAGLDAPEVQ
jgi:hypothetical protein